MHLHLPANFAEMNESDEESGFDSDSSSISTVPSIEIEQRINQLEIELWLLNHQDNQLLDNEVDDIDDSVVSSESDDDDYDAPGEEDLDIWEIWNLREEVFDKFTDIDPWNLADDLFLLLLL